MGKKPMQNQGWMHERTQHNPREQAFAERWEWENVNKLGVNYGMGLLQDLFVKPGQTFLRPNELEEEITPRDRRIVATVIQWLGSNVGMSFLHAALNKCGYTIKGPDTFHLLHNEPPTAPGVYWWWNGDPNSDPIDVRVDTAGCPYGNLYALPGQHGWNWLQPVKDMKGYWMPCLPPEIPDYMRKKAAEGGDV